MINSKQFGNITISVIVGGIILLLTPDIFPKYELSLFDKMTAPNNRSTHVLDIDGNGVAELIYHKDYQGIPSLFVRSLEGEAMGQLIARGESLLYGELVIGDYDHNGAYEVLIPYQSNDSLFLIGTEMIRSNVEADSFKYHFFIEKIESFNGKKDVQFIAGVFEDLDNDGFDEALFYLQAEYTRQPRKIYAYNFVTGELSKSPFFGSRLRDLLIVDLDGDGEIDLFPTIYNTRNYQPHDLFADHYAWFVWLDNGLNFNSSPVKLVDSFRRIQVPHLIKQKLENYILAVSFTPQSPFTDSVFTLIDSKGNVRKSKDFELDSLVTIKQTFQESDSTIGLVLNSGEIWTINESMALKQKGTLNNYNEMLRVDIDDDGDQELIVRGGGLLTVYRKDLSDPATFSFETNVHLNKKWSVANYLGRSIITVQSPTTYFLLSYEYNKYYWIKYPFFLLLFLSLYGLILGTHRVRSLLRSEKEKKTLELQLRDLRKEFNTRELSTKVDDLLMGSSIPDRIQLNTRSGFVLVNQKEILYCEADSNYTIVHLTHGRREVSSQTLGKIEGMISFPGFKRVGRSMLINTNFLYKVDRKLKMCQLVHEGSIYKISIPEGVHWD